MFLGKQNGHIALVANTREELENTPCIAFDEIEETDIEYTLYNGKYLTPAELEQAQKQNQREELIKQLDDLDLNAIRPLRAIQAGTGTQDDTDKLEELEAQAEQIRAELRELEG